MFLAAILLLATGLLGQDSPSVIRDDERILFFPALARPLAGAGGGSWRVDLHGWIFEPEEDCRFRAAVVEGLRRSLRLDRSAPESRRLRERIRAFLVDSERGKRVGVRIGTRTFVLPPSAPNGHFRGTVEVPAADLSPEPLASPGAFRGPRVRAVLRDSDARVFDGEIHILEDEGLSVISDIDDTIKVSHTRSRRELLASTFLREYEAVPGMAAVFRKLDRRGAAFHYVSACPWQLQGPVAAFLREAGFPAGTFHMKEVRLRDRTVLRLFAEPYRHKLKAIEGLIAAFPRRSWILVGDMGQQDAEVYGEIARRHPDRIRGILVRRLDGTPEKPARLRRALRGIPHGKWRVFDSASEADAFLDRLVPAPGGGRGPAPAERPAARAGEPVPRG